MKQSYLVGQILYQPRQDGNSNGNIGGHQIYLSTDGATYNLVAYGTFLDDATTKVTTIPPTNARYLRIVALTEAGNRGAWSSAAEIDINVATQAAPGSPAGKGAWGYTVNFPLVPVSLMNIYNGNILAWSSFDPSTFGGASGTQTITAEYFPGTQTVTKALITNTMHDMFCEGLSMDFNGNAIATGGNTASAASIYNSGANTWSKANTLQIARGYQAQLTVSTGNTFTIGASWSGGQGGKNGELYNAAAGTWSLLTGTPVAPLLTADAQGVYRADNHAWLFAWKGGSVFQAGPSVAMNWYGTTGTGTQQGAGTRTGDGDSMCGDAAMYDAIAGKILTVGGSPNYQNSDATSNAHIITLTNANVNPVVTTIANMAFPRAFANSVVMPDGKVFITGGQSYAVPFSDDTSQLTPEMFDPATNTFTQLAQQQIPRNYHSTAVLLPDATVMSAGGGLCGTCSTNHYDGQIFKPPYLYTASGTLATRPVINSVSVTTVKVPQTANPTFTITTNSAVTSFSIVRLASTTHTVNTDQRRIKLTITATSGFTYTVQIPTKDPGQAVPGYWYVFALTSAGVPSVSKTIKLTL
ncbi:uncharacterized protein KY384_007970 [Bacidia gigantensis]|uniref:uncharacterized protein n=1 Tax=Bacidia gigantensis TaxID=2732470 RepID=UPI001D0472CC|nr:uncharacterized protein KY384_007970 [Bacidia gigantensis]KAG8527816.1 hypothetical protein KY384_007970 [Bacidia gigantensis]